MFSSMLIKHLEIHLNPSVCKMKLMLFCLICAVPERSWTANDIGDDK